ncbi:type IV pilus secretin PilQ [Arhodomonas sp. SL1]|uniref:type IV pilus secretin PilQ n=1 Tax=Arhodomonas sp. SL1 TaxID=3425691 RepID=UPI003F884CB7
MSTPTINGIATTPRVPRRLSLLASLPGALLMLLLSAFPAAPILAAGLTDMSYATLSGNRVRVDFTFDGDAPEPRSFRTVDPARIALDFQGAENRTGSRQLDIDVGAVENVGLAAAGGRTRAVIRLTNMVPYDIRMRGDTASVFLAAPGMQSTGAPRTQTVADNEQAENGARAATDEGGTGASGRTMVEQIDFRRGPDGAGRVLIRLNASDAPVNIERQGSTVIADLEGVFTPERLRRRLDVTDFATPVTTIETRQRNGATRVTVEAANEFEQVAYQADETFTIELKPFTEEEQEAAEEREYTGERLSLNFQDIEVRSVLQLLADFTGLNMVVSDSVSGNITLRLDDVPWDQALDIILQAKGLDKRRTDNVMWVAPAEEIAERERIQAEAARQQEELAPLRTEFIQINYAKAAQLATLIRGDEGESLLSERGNVSIDERTNTLIVQDTSANIGDIRQLINHLDIPVRQVLIESRIVIADDSFTQDLGVQFGYSRQGEIGDMGAVVGGTVVPGADSEDAAGNTGVNIGGANENLLVDLPASTSGAEVGLALGKIGSYLLQLELSAMESEGRGQVISSPKVITSNQKEAYIEQGEEIPFQEATSSGATNVEFKKAVLGLTVTPQITPDDRVLLDLEVSKDSRGEQTPSGPAIDTQKVGTQVLVDNGETVVLGGVFERTKRNDVRRVPFFGSLPVLGNLFKNTSRIDENRELLIFVTPKIVEGNVALQR